MRDLCQWMLVELRVCMWTVMRIVCCTRIHDNNAIHLFLNKSTPVLTLFASPFLTFFLTYVHPDTTPLHTDMVRVIS